MISRANNEVSLFKVYVWVLMSQLKPPGSIFTVTYFNETSREGCIYVQLYAKITPTCSMFEPQKAVRI